MRFVRCFETKIHCQRMRAQSRFVARHYGAAILAQLAAADATTWEGGRSLRVRRIWVQTFDEFLKGGVGGQGGQFGDLGFQVGQVLRFQAGVLGALQGLQGFLLSAHF